MKLYRAYVIVGGEVYFECTVIAWDEVGAKVKAILLAKCDPDTAQVMLQRIGTLPED